MLAWYIPFIFAENLNAKYLTALLPVLSNMSPGCDTVPLFSAPPTQSQGMWHCVLPADDTVIHNDPPSVSG
jgi:hypothetical protein